MMAQSTPFPIVLVAVLLINTLFYCSAENVYCVTPTATLCTSCPHNTHCATLSEYAQQAEVYFTSNTTMVFLPGDHVLDRNITVANVSRLIIHGESSSDNIATVVRNGSVGFNFTKMVNFNIYSLAFTSYNKSWGYASHPASNSALLMQSTQNAKLVNCSFHDNLGNGLTVHNTSITLAENKFIHNQCGCESLTEVCKLGCGVTALNSNLTFTGNTTFLKNSHNSTYLSTSEVGAGAISAVASSLHFTGTNNFLDNVNSANKKRQHGGYALGVGGAIYISNNAVLTFNGTNNFVNNSAKRNGGAIYAKTNISLTFIGTNNFSNNLAGVNGGAIYTLDNVVLVFIGTNDFIGNSADNNGGAIYTTGNTVLTFIGTNNFIGNHVNGYYSGDGGAIYTLDHGVLSFNGTNNFINNSGSIGGAIRASTNISLTFNGTNNFINNSAEVGSGAISISYNGVLIFNGTNNFINNSAQVGSGAISISYNGVLIFNGTNNFINNSAQVGSGAISISYNGVLIFNGTNNLINNSAQVGSGAISISYNGVLIFNGTNNFISNSAEVGSGAISISQNTVLTFTGTNNFISNSAGLLNGGAINARTNVSLTFIGTSDFSNNSAQFDNGGAIYAETNTSLTFIGTSYFSINTAEFGGAISILDYAVLTFNGTSKFTGNSANLFYGSGGAIYVETNISLCFTGTSSFSNNSAMEGGAISANVYSTLTFDGSISFTSNGHYQYTDITINADNRENHRGAIYLSIGSAFSILPHTTVCWENNLEGAIYVSDINPLIYCTRIATHIPNKECFFQLPGQNLSRGIDVKLVFTNNSADDAGSVLYGGAIDNCKLTHGLDSYSSGEVFDMLVHIDDENDYNTTSKISSDPLRICQCKNNLPDCSRSWGIIVQQFHTHTQSILVKHFRFLWLQLDKEMEQFLAQ